MGWHSPCLPPLYLCNRPCPQGPVAWSSTGAATWYVPLPFRYQACKFPWCLSSAFPKKFWSAPCSYASAKWSCVIILSLSLGTRSPKMPQLWGGCMSVHPSGPADQYFIPFLPSVAGRAERWYPCCPNSDCYTGHLGFVGLLGRRCCLLQLWHGQPASGVLRSIWVHHNFPFLLHNLPKGMFNHILNSVRPIHGPLFQSGIIPLIVVREDFCWKASSGGLYFLPLWWWPPKVNRVLILLHCPGHCTYLLKFRMGSSASKVYFSGRS